MAVALSGSIVLAGSITGSLLGTASYSSNTEFFDGLDSSVFALTSSLGSFTSSLNDFSSSINTYTASNNANIAALNAATASLYNATASLYLTTASLNQYTASLNTRSASFACIDSTNNFACAQYFSNASNAISFSSTGSLYSDGGMRLTKDLYVSGTSYFNNVTVFGTQSINYITSSQLNIASNLITVNTATPSVRFGGLAVYDSGSLGTGLTGSILWDSENNHWVYSNPSGSSYSGGMFISGPRSAALGSEVGTTNNALMKGQGGDHITSSMVFEVSGSVGVGTSSPSAKLDVAGNITLTNAANPSFTFCSSDSAIINRTGTNSGLYFQKAGSTQLVIDTNSNVGINMASPLTKLHIQLAGTTTTTCMACLKDGALVLYNANAGSSTNGTVGIFGQNAGALGLSSGIGFSRESSGDWGTQLRFYTHPTVTTEIDVVCERMRITGDGNVGIGTTNPATKLHVSNNGAYGIEIDVANEIIQAYNRSTSDYNEIKLYSSNLRFFNGGSATITERMRITSDGVVGIGTTSPVLNDGNLVVAGCVGTGQGITCTTAQINIWETTSGNKAGLWFGAVNCANVGVIGSRTATGNIAFQTYCAGWGERMRITYNGNVGIGTTTPLYILHTSAEGAAGQIMADQYGTVGSNILLRSARGTSASPTATQAGDLLGSIGSRGYDGSAFSGGGRAGIYMYAGENFTSTNQGTFLIIGTTALCAASRTERVRITTEGNVGIGTDSPGTRLEVLSRAADADRTLPHNVLTITAEQGNAPYGFFGGAILFKNRSYTSGLVESSRIRSVIYDDGAPNNCGGGLWFETTPTPGGTLTPSLKINYGGVACFANTVCVGGDVILLKTTTISAATGGPVLTLGDTTSEVGMTGGISFAEDLDNNPTRVTMGMYYDGLANRMHFVGACDGSGGVGSSMVCAPKHMTILRDSGNVGIGITSPGNFNGLTFTGPFLDVAGILQIKGTSANTIAALQFGGDTYRKALIYSTIGTEDPALIFGIGTSGSSSSGTERMRITSGGQVAIGNNISTSTEANLFLGAQGTIEGGQLVLQKGTSCSCATHLDNYQDSFRVLVGDNTGSNGVHMVIDHKTRNACLYGTLQVPIVYNCASRWQLAGSVEGGNNACALVINVDGTRAVRVRGIVGGISGQTMTSMGMYEAILYRIGSTGGNESKRFAVLVDCNASPGNGQGIQMNVVNDNLYIQNKTGMSYAQTIYVWAEPFFG